MILIVDDKSENIFSLKPTLELSGFQVDAAYSGEEALKKVLKNDYTLIILDVQMPGMDGFEVAEALGGFSRAKDIPIIFVSAVNIDKKFIARGYSSGAVDYITKPIDPDIFILKVKTLHRLYEQQRELNNIRLSLLEEVEVRKQAEAEMKSLIEEQKSILSSLPQIAFTVKPDGAIEYVNEHWFGYSEDAKKFPEVYEGETPVFDRISECMRTGRICVSETRIRIRSSNKYRYHLLRLVPVRQDKKIVKWVGTFTDIQQQKTDNERLEMRVSERTAELTQKNEQLEMSNHELQQFASVASHDLQEPLRKIQMYSNRIKERFSEKESDVLGYMDRVINASDRMSTLISDLLAFSRLSVRSLFSKTDLNVLLDEILGDLEYSIREKQAEIIVAPLPAVDAVPGQIRQVFQNLLSNALKFTAKGVKPQIKVTGRLIINEQGKEMAQIEVRDNGIGFDEQYLEKIFTIFQRLNPKETYEGTGIGLAIVKKIIEKHKGSITAHSSEGQGAAFVIELPVNQTEKETD